MSSTKALMIIGAALALSGCVQAPGHLQEDFGYAVRQNVTAQIADPDARYARKINPASNGMRATSAQDRYVHGDVIQPTTEGTGAISAPSGSGPPPASGRD